MKLSTKVLSVTLFMALALLTRSVIAGEVYIAVGEPRIKKSVLAFPDVLASGGASSPSKSVRDTALSDLGFTNLFSIQSPDAYIEKVGTGITLDKFRLSDWTTIGTEFLVKTSATTSGDEITIELRLYDVLGTKQILGKRYVAKTNEPKLLGHTIANDLFEALTGRPGIFFTKIAMVCNRSGTKEIWTMDFDGSNAKQVTSHGTLAFSPGWSGDNRHLIYSVYAKNSRNVKNIDLYRYDFATKRSVLLSNRKGINSGAAYQPGTNKIALTMSFLGNPELFLLNPENKQVTRLTKSLGFDVDPTWSPDGKKLAFVSTRHGKPMIYAGREAEMSINPAAATRITYAGVYNATPSWSPTGKKLAFASQVEGKGNKFDIFLVNPDAPQSIERLTQDEGTNEDPFFSPDGNFIAFTSTRSGGQKNIYVMTADGKNSKRISFGLGNCESPKWSAAAKAPW